MKPLLWQVLRETAGAPDKLHALLDEATDEQLILLCQRVEDAAGLVPEELTDFGQRIGDVYRRRFGHEIPSMEPDPIGKMDLSPTAESEELLWKIIGIHRVAGVPWPEAFSSLTRSELLRLFATVIEVQKRTASQIESKLGPDPEEDDWFALSMGMIEEGKDEHDRQLANPQSAPGLVRSLEESPLQAIDDEHRRRYGVFIRAFPK